MSVHCKSYTAQIKKEFSKKSKQKPKAPPNTSSKLQSGHNKYAWKHSAGSPLSPINHICHVSVENYFQTLLHTAATLLPK